MYSVIVVPPACARPAGRIEIASGESLAFGRRETSGGLTIAHDGVPRIAGEISAQHDVWLLTNRSTHQTYVVENPEGAGEHIKIAPGRVDAPVAFKFSRVVLPAAGDLLTFDVWAPRQRFASAEDRELPGSATAPAFTLDRTKRYFAVLAALCEPRLRGEPHAPTPAVDQLVRRLRPAWPTVNRSSVYWNIDYLALKPRVRPGPETAEPGRRANGKKPACAQRPRLDCSRCMLAAISKRGSGAGASRVLARSTSLKWMRSMWSPMGSAPCEPGETR